MKIYLIFLLLPLSLSLLLAFNSTESGTSDIVTTAPIQELYYDDHIYDSDIRTVQFYRGSFENSYPVIYKNNPMPLTLEFDEWMPWEQIESDYFVEYVSCTYDWQPSGILPIEFYEGFTNQRIDLYQRSEFTKVPYVHYSFSFPRENEFFRMSGNYLALVYRNDSDRTPVITRRFVVVENQVAIQPTGMLDARIERQQLDELRFMVTPAASMQIIDPNMDLKLVVMQNFRWDNALYGVRPTFFRDGQYEYQINLKFEFQSGNEFRFNDIRSTRLYGVNVEDVTETEDLWFATLFEDETRRMNLYGPQRDLNGSFFIETNEWPDGRIQADYMQNSFRLKSAEFQDKQVYVFGEMCDWQTKPEFLMEYNAMAGRYETDIMLKQGLYDYQYVVYDPASGTLNETAIEGRPVDTENYYCIMVYFRSAMDRNDRLVAFRPMNYYDE